MMAVVSCLRKMLSFNDLSMQISMDGEQNRMSPRFRLVKISSVNDRPWLYPSLFVSSTSTDTNGHICREVTTNEEKMKIILFLVVIVHVHSFAQEKLQVLTTKKVENCEHRAQVGDTLYMQYLVRSFCSVDHG